VGSNVPETLPLYSLYNWSTDLLLLSGTEPLDFEDVDGGGRRGVL